jgi:hypothetical protein
MAEVLEFQRPEKGKRLQCKDCAYFVRKSPKRAFCTYNEIKISISGSRDACKRFFDL